MLPGGSRVLPAGCIPIMVDSDNCTRVCWFALRDLTRRNAKEPAYKRLGSMGIELFTPMMRRLTVRRGKRVREEIPYMQDLLFVHDTRERLDPIIEQIPTLQYRYVRGKFCEPMVVPEADMARFMQVVGDLDAVRYYRPEEITSQMIGRRIRIIGGPLDGCEGALLTTRGSKRRRLLVELPDLITVAVEVDPEFIELL